MKYYMRSKEGDFKFEVSAYCGHPDMRDNNAASVGCSGNCEECRHSVARTTIPEMMELLRRADCNYKR